MKIGIPYDVRPSARDIKCIRGQPLFAESAYGGTLQKTRFGRSRPRPLPRSTQESMHLVLRSTKAKGEWSFRRPQNQKRLRSLLTRFTGKYGIRVLSLANVGNHLHFHLKIKTRKDYTSFIRALTGAIVVAITCSSRWKPLKKTAKDRFWDYRPFTRIVKSRREVADLRDYIVVNQLEGLGLSRREARFALAWEKAERGDRHGDG